MSENADNKTGEVFLGGTNLINTNNSWIKYDFRSRHSDCRKHNLITYSVIW